MSFTVSSKPLVGEYDFILESDPALEESEEATEGYKQYLNTGDESHLVIKAGEKPTRWKLRNINPKQYQILHSCQAPLWQMPEELRDANMPVVMYEYCRSCLVGWDLESDEGGDVPFKVELDKDQGAKVASKETMGVLHGIDPSLPVQIGFAAWRRTYLNPLS